MKKVLLLFVVLAQSVVAQDSTRYTKSSVYSDVYQSCNVYLTIACGANVPAGTYNVLCSHTTTMQGTGQTYVPGCYNFVKSAATGTPQNIVIAVQTFNAVQGGGANPYASSEDFTASGIEGHSTLSASGGEQVIGTEIRDASIPGWYVAGATTAPTLYSWTITVGTGALANQAKFPMGIAANDGKAHTMSVYDNGTLVGSVSVAAGTAGGAVQVSTGAPVYGSANAGDIYSYVLDGKTVGNASGVIPATAYLEGNTSWTAPQQTYTAEYTQPQPTTTPTGTQTNGGNVTTDPSPGSTDVNGNPIPPTTAVNNGNTTISGGTTGATNQDIYNDVLHALDDAGNATNSAAFVPGLVVGSQPAGVDTGAGATALQTAGNNAISSWQNVQNDQLAIWQNTTLNLPTGLSSLTSWGGNVTFAGRTEMLTFDWSGYSSIIAGFRLCCLFACGLLTFFASVRIVRGGVA